MIAGNDSRLTWSVDIRCVRPLRASAIEQADGGTSRSVLAWQRIRSDMNTGGTCVEPPALPSSPQVHLPDDGCSVIGVQFLSPASILPIPILVLAEVRGAFELLLRQVHFVSTQPFVVCQDLPR